MEKYEDEIKLMDLLNLLWKKKWLIILPTLLCVVIVGIISFCLPLIWEVDAIIQPSKILVKTEQGQFEEVVLVGHKQIVGQISQESYNRLIAAELNMDIRTLPKLKAENIKDTNLIKVSIRERDTERAKLILLSLFKHLKAELDEKTHIEMKGIDSQVKDKEIEKTMIEDEIKVFKSKLRIIKQRKKEIEAEMSDVRNRIELLEKEQLSTLKKDKKSESESLGMLLYSNEIQQSLRYHNTLNELLNNKKIEEEDLNLELDNGDKKISQIENTINDLNEERGRIDYAQLIKEPTSSLSPVSPRKKLNVLIAGILSLIIFTILAFFIEYIQKNKAKEGKA